MPSSNNLIPAKLNYNKVDEIGNNVAKAVMSRDYKGFGTSVETTNGVIKDDNA